MRASIYSRLAVVVFCSSLTASAWGATFTGGSFFRADSTGNNLNGGGGILFRGGWTTVLGQENVPGNPVYSFWLSQYPAPAPENFITPSAALSVPLVAGANTFYFWADKDDTLGGSDTFGLNLFFNDAGPTSPSISGYVVPGVGQIVQANSAINTPGLNMVYVPGTGTLSFLDGDQLIVLSSFTITDTGGLPAGPGSVDLVNPYTPPASPNGITDTYGQFTLTVSIIPEPGSLGLLGLGVLSFLCRRRKQ